MFAPEAVVVVVVAGVVVALVLVLLVLSVVLGLAVLVLFGLARFTEGMIARRARFEGRPAD